MKIKTRRYYIYYLLKIFFFLMRLVPRNISQFLADILGKGAFCFLEKYKKTTVSNLDTVFGNDSDRNVRIARDVFRNLAKNGADWLKMSYYDVASMNRLVTEISGLEHLDAALSSGKGAILLASHFGNWELLSIYLYSNGYSGAIIAKKLYFHKYDNFITGLRKRFGANIIYRDDSPRKMLKVFKDGNILGMLADQDVDSVDGVFVKFFGKEAYTPTAPVKIAMSCGVSLVPAFMVRKPDNTYKLIVEKAITPSSEGNKEENVKRYTQEWTDVLERYVRQYPEQWVWLHQRWKSRPLAEKNLAECFGKGGNG